MSSENFFTKYWELHKVRVKINDACTKLDKETLVKIESCVEDKKSGEVFFKVEVLEFPKNKTKALKNKICLNDIVEIKINSVGDWIPDDCINFNSPSYSTREKMILKVIPESSSLSLFNLGQEYLKAKYIALCESYGRTMLAVASTDAVSEVFFKVNKDNTIAVTEDVINLLTTSFLVDKGKNEIQINAPALHYNNYPGIAFYYLSMTDSNHQIVRKEVETKQKESKKEKSSLSRTGELLYNDSDY